MANEPRWGATFTDNDGNLVIGKGNTFFQLEDTATGSIYSLTESMSRSGYYYSDSIPVSLSKKYYLLIDGQRVTELCGNGQTIVIVNT